MVTAMVDSPNSVEQTPSSVGVSFNDVYEQYFEFVWRIVQRMGMRSAGIDDAVQDVFIVVHRRLADFEGRSSLKTWLSGIALRVVHDHRRTRKRKGDHDALDDTVIDAGPSPLENAANNQAMKTLDGLLDELDDDRRSVFVMAELEQMTAPEISEVLGVGLNTVYSRLRLARSDFNAAVSRFQRRIP